MSNKMARLRRYFVEYYTQYDAPDRVFTPPEGRYVLYHKFGKQQFTL